MCRIMCFEVGKAENRLDLLGKTECLIIKAARSFSKIFLAAVRFIQGGRGNPLYQTNDDSG
jgi:hypothetical protein